MPKRTKLKKSRFSLRKVMAIIAIAAIVLALAAWLIFRHPSSPAGPNQKTSAGAPVNLNPATSQDNTANNQHKAALGGQNSQNTANTGTKTVVTPVVTGVSRTTVKAFVQGVVENGGTCTATLTKGTSTVTASSTGTVNASDTSCATINISPPLTSGTWIVTVSYNSPDAQGSSAAQTFEVQ